MKKLKKSDENRMICGVCAGIAEYFEIDVNVVRLIWVIASLVSGLFVGVAAYLISAVLIPMD